MANKQPMQADGGGKNKGAPDGVGTTDHHGKTESESQGGAYPRPKGDADAHPEGLLGHGGQSKMGYHGTGQLGEQKVGGKKNVNAVTGKA